ncbi:hypothetical protein HRI_004479300 [Hibiscus trionum]|uniref:Uncharacterized protein n=1 Tax=Hibiscus trionum TaxID=183268 RepID=A0A9W7J525_HIBTR|nr:hypothetical protein HRI_004479300 [Hibiscus trionum]
MEESSEVSTLQYIKQYLLDEFSPVGLGSFSSENKWITEAKPQASTSESDALYSQTSTSDSSLSVSDFDSVDNDDFSRFSAGAFEFQVKHHIFPSAKPRFSSNSS